MNNALDFFEKYYNLTKSLYESYPNNVSFKNGLAIAYYKLGQHYEKIENIQQAISYFEQAETLWFKLVTDFPYYMEFKKNLDTVNNILKRLK